MPSRQRPVRIDFRLREIACALGAMWLLVSGAPVWAQPSVTMRAYSATGAGNDRAPSFRAVIGGLPPGLGKASFTLRQTDIEPPVQVAATRALPWAKSDDRALIVLLIEGNGRWMGSETYAQDTDDAPQPGAFTGVTRAIDQFTNAGPRGSLAAVLVYGDGQVAIKQPPASTADLNGGVLGTQRDYSEILDLPLLLGLDSALGLFDQHRDYRPILVIIGDGTGEREDIAADLRERVNQLRELEVAVFTIFFESFSYGDPIGRANMRMLGWNRAFKAGSGDNIATFAGDIKDQLGASYHVSFPGCTAEQPPRCFTHDGAEHPFVVSVMDEEFDELQVKTHAFGSATATPAATASDRSKSPVAPRPAPRQSGCAGCAATAPQSGVGWLWWLGIVALLVQRRSGHRLR